MMMILLLLMSIIIQYFLHPFFSRFHIVVQDIVDSGTVAATCTYFDLFICNMSQKPKHYRNSTYFYEKNGKSVFLIQSNKKTSHRNEVVALSELDRAVCSLESNLTYSNRMLTFPIRNDDDSLPKFSIIQPLPN